MKKLEANPIVTVTRSLKKEWNKVKRKGSKKRSKIDRNYCITTYCNPTCKDTLITEKKDTAAMKKEFKAHLNSFSKDKRTQKEESEDLNNFKNTVRKTVKKYNEPLTNGFYKGLPSADIDMLKRSGATSGCRIELSRHLKERPSGFDGKARGFFSGARNSLKRIFTRGS